MTRIVNGFSNILQKTLIFDQRFYSWTNHASLGLGIHKEYVWLDENPCVIQSHHLQQQFSINLSAGILGDYLTSPHIIQSQADSHNYFHFLQTHLNGLMENVSYNNNLHVWFKHDDAQSHYNKEVHQ
jgi:hypothetical protein